jgi:hypothetical protein
VTRKVRKVKPVKKVKRVRQVVDDGWTPPTIDMKGHMLLFLCAWVHPKLRQHLPDLDGICVHDPCPCKAAKKHACEIPENIWHTGDK